MNNLKSSQEKVSIKAIKFGWLFQNREGGQFFKLLNDFESVEIFSLPIIQNIIKFFWKHYKTRIIYFLFVPFLIYFLLFSVYSTWFLKRRMDHNDGQLENFGLVCTLSAVLIG